MRKKQSDPQNLKVVPFDTFEKQGHEALPGTEYVLENGAMLRCCCLEPFAFVSENRLIDGKLTEPHFYLPLTLSPDGQPLSLRVADGEVQVENPLEPVGKEIPILQKGVTYGLAAKRTEPGYVLANGAVLLSQERDAFGNYYGGAGVDGMYLKTGRMYGAVTDSEGTVRAFRLMKERTRAQPENYLAAAEMSVEGNYNQIDGIINNEKPSILTALKQTPAQEDTQALPPAGRGTER